MKLGPELQLLLTTDTVGGVWTYSVELARALASHRVRVTLASLGPPPTADQRGQLRCLPHVQLVESTYALEWMPDPWDDLRKAETWLLGLADQAHADVIHLNHFAHGNLPSSLPRLVVGHSCVLSWYQAVRGEEAGEDWNRYRAAVRAGLAGADWVVAPTATMLGGLRHHYGPLRSSSVIANGIHAPAEAAVSKEPFIFTAGRVWDEAKNLALVARVADRLPWPVRLASLPHPDGRDPDIGRIDNLGRLDADAMARMYARASIYVLPARYEPFGLTPLEAAGHRCALVLGDIPTLREVWGQAALFVSPGDTAALAAALERLCRDRSLRSEMGRRAWQRASLLTADAMAEKYAQLYRNLAEAGRGRRRKEAARCAS